MEQIVVPAPLLPYYNAIWPQLGWLILVMLLDLIGGVAIAVKQKRFQWQRLADCVVDYTTKLVGYLIAEAISLIPVSYASGLVGNIGNGIFLLIMTSALASTLGHLAALGLLSNAAGKVGIPPTTGMR